jgi:hypothetical protein
MFGYIIGHILFGLVISFVVTGLCWLMGWRRNPKWKAKFWWITFALGGVLEIRTAIGMPPENT